MFRGFLIILVTLVVLIATVVGVVGAGMRRIAAAQRQADADWHPPAAEASLTAATNPSASAEQAADAQEPVRTFESIDLWARDATLHGGLQLLDARPGKGRSNPPDEPKALAKWQQKELMSGRASFGYLTGFDGSDNYAEWTMNVSKPGDYEIDITYACAQWQEGGRFTVKLADKELPFTAEGTRNDSSYRVVPIGKLTLPGGDMTVAIRGVRRSPNAHCFMNLRSIQLIPVPPAAAP